MSTPPSNITAPEHWAEWFEKCALVLCCDETRRALGVFAHERYKRYLLIALREQGRSMSELPVDAIDLLESPQPGTCWLDLEASYWHQPKLGKNPGNSAVNVAEAKIYKKFHQEFASSLSTPEAARDYLEAKSTQNLIKNRCRSIITESIFRHGGRVNESGISREETILDELQDASRSSLLESEADEIAQRIFVDLTAENKILIFAYEENHPLDDPFITARLGRKKSVLYQRQNLALKELAPLLRKYQAYPEDLQLIKASLFNLLTEWVLSPECGIGDCLIRGEANT